MNKKNNIKEFLKTNKIFIDFISSILLSIMAIFVSINSCQINKRQVENEELLNMPLFKICKEQFSWETTNDSEKVTIENVGGYAYNYNFEKRIFLFCQYYPLNGKEDKQIYLPIDDMLNSSFTTSNYTGILQYYYSISNIEYFNKLYQQTIGIKNGFLDIKLLYYIIISYNDFKGHQHKDYFIINGIDGGRKINKDERLDYLLSLKWPSYNISEITLEQIIELLKQKQQPNYTNN